MTQSGIFNYTEVNIVEIEPDRLNTTVKSILKRPKSTNSLLPVLPQKKGNWPEFLKSKCHLGNTRPPQQPAPHIQAKLDDVNSRIEQEFKNSKSGLPASSLKELERSTYVQSQINDYFKQVMAYKHTCNDLISGNNHRLQEVKALEAQLKDLDECESEKVKHLIENKRTKEQEYTILSRKLQEEQRYHKVLLNMKNTRSTEKVKLERPKAKLSMELQLLDAKLTEASNFYTRIQSQLALLNKKLSELKQHSRSRRQENQDAVGTLMKKYEDQRRLQYFMDMEFQRGQEAAKQEGKAQLMLEIEENISQLKQESEIYNEISEIDKIKDTLEDKFKGFLKGANVSSIEDVMPYYDYLLKNQKLLESFIHSRNKTLEDIQEKLEKYRKSLQSTKLYLPDEAKPYSAEILENFIELKEAEIASKVRNIKNLNDIKMSVSNIFTRAFYQLKEDDEAFTRDNQDSLVFKIAYCCIKLGQMVEFLQVQPDFYYIESINTDMHYRYVPEFLKLNPTGQSIPSDEEPVTFQNLRNIED